MEISLVRIIMARIVNYLKRFSVLAYGKLFKFRLYAHNSSYLLIIAANGCCNSLCEVVSLRLCAPQLRVDPHKNKEREREGEMRSPRLKAQLATDEHNNLLGSLFHNNNNNKMCQLVLRSLFACVALLLPLSRLMTQIRSRTDHRHF